MRWRLHAAVFAAAFVLSLSPHGALGQAEQTCDKNPAPRVDLYGDPLPRGAVSRIGTIRLRHNGTYASCVSFSPDGKRIVSGGRDCALRFWRLADGSLSLVISLPLPVTTVAWSPDGQLVAASVAPAAHGDPAVFVCDAVSGSRLVQLRCMELADRRGRRDGAPPPLLSVAFSPDGKTCFGSGEGQGVFAWDVPNGAEIERLHISDICSSQLALSPDGRLLAGACKEEDNVYRVGLWNAQTGLRIRSWAAERCRWASFAFSPAGETLAMGEGKRLQFWRVADGAAMGEPTKLKLPRFARFGSIECLQYFPDGRRMAFLDDAHASLGRLLVWDLTRQAVPWLPKDNRSRYGMALSPDGALVATAGHRIALYDGETGAERLAPRPEVRLHAWTENFSADGAFFVDGCSVWNVASGEFAASVPSQSLKVRLADGKSCFLEHDSRREKLVLRELGAQEPLGELPAGCWGAIPAFNSRFGSHLLLSVAGSGIDIYDITHRRKASRLSFSDRFKMAPLLAELYIASADSTVLALLESDDAVSFWNVDGGRLLSRIHFQQAVQRSREAFAATCFLSANGSRFLRNSPLAGTLMAWDTRTGRLLEERPFAGERLAMMPDGSAIVTRASTGGPLAFHATGIGIPTDVAYPDALALAASRHGACLRRRPLESLGADHRDEFRDADFACSLQQKLCLSPDGQILAQVDDDGRIVLAETFTRRTIETFSPDQRGFISLSFSPDGGRLASMMLTGSVLIWDMTFGAAEKPPVPCLESLWTELAGDDAYSAHRAAMTMSLYGSQAVHFLASCVHSAAPDEALIARLMRELDNDKFQTREDASRHLRRLGRVVEPALRAAAQSTKSLEVRRRLQAVLANLEEPALDAKTIQILRAIRVLARVRSPESQRLLRELASGSPEATITIAAQAALSAQPW